MRPTPRGADRQRHLLDAIDTAESVRAYFNHPEVQSWIDRNANAALEAFSDAKDDHARAMAAARAKVLIDLRRHMAAIEVAAHEARKRLDRESDHE